jgi:hypothetical protein
MDEVTRDVQGYIPCVYFFADDVVLVDESRAGVNRKLELWWETLESKDLDSVELKPNIQDVTSALLHMKKNMLVWKIK